MFIGSCSLGDQDVTRHWNNIALSTALILSLPYYHPPVSRLAFRYILSTPPSIRIEVVLLSPDDTPTDPGSRIYRTCLSLLDALHRYGWGALTNYKKRVQHDCVIPRETYQDLYLVMRERFKGLVDTWVESTDPLKHVFEDIAAADIPADEPWRGWGRPTGGFLDFGCGNGLLTHILLSCGYAGLGIDLRARASWQTYPPHTQAHLRVDAFDPHTLAAGAPPTVYTAPGQFVVANHADELTPGERLPQHPVLRVGVRCALRAREAGYVPARGDDDAGGLAALVETLNLGADNGNTSGYAQYRIWLARLSRHCGWEVECEVLRIPSTRNWAIVGRRRTRSQEEAQANVDAILQGVQDRGIFKARTPEGKAGKDH
ncbi:hypothetical protein B0H17DRAFT_1202760 [Mycena rosella]|uniref:tRNA (uracil-O(2)-)-methyltransferase n=1 Tax=Mycena rosella TaxID=1033263 RepID=A0AAD7GFI5_MYCRO|nr:hypothetical protein B0H17DRAFT_1202760 [Mycena rosella]